MQAKGVVDAAAATADGDGSNAGAPETSAAAGGADSGAGSAMEVDDGDADDHEDADDDHGDHEADDYDSGDDEDAQHIDGMNVDEGGGSTTAADGQQHQPGQSPATAGDAAVGTGGGAGAASSSSSAAVPAPAVAGGEVGLYGSAHRIQEKLTKQPKLITGGYCARVCTLPLSHLCAALRCLVGVDQANAVYRGVLCGAVPWLDLRFTRVANSTRLCVRATDSYPCRRHTAAVSGSWRRVAGVVVQ